LAILKKQDWKRIRKQNLPQTIFLAITIISAGLTVLPILNYTKYYLALANFNFTVTNVTMSTNQLYTPANAIVKINITLTASNPTDYSGLVVADVGCVLSYNGSYHTVTLPPVSLGQQPTYVYTNLWQLESVTTPMTRTYPLRPNSNTTILIETSIAGNSDQNAADFVNYLESLEGSGSNQIDWSISCRLGLITFLNTYAEGPAYFSPITPLGNSSMT